MFRHFALFLPILLLVPQSCLAGVISLASTMTFSAHIGENSLDITGSISTTNKGTETAQRVAPFLSLREFSWNGEAKSIDPGTSVTWEFRESFHLNKCSITENCQFMRGTYAVPILLYYEDANGYRFSAPSVSQIIIGEMNAREQAALLAAPLNLKIRSTGDGSDFQVEAEGFYSGSALGKIRFSIFHSREFSSAPMEFRGDLSPGATIKKAFAVRNVSALPNSAYPVFVVAEWADSDRHYALVASETLQVQLQNSSMLLVYGAVASLFLSILAFVYFRYRSKRA